MPVQALTHTEATATQIMFVNRRMKILASFTSPSCSMIMEDLAACLDGGLPVLLSGDLYAKHVEWNSRLSTRRGELLRDYADEKSCLIFGPLAPTTSL